MLDLLKKMFSADKVRGALKVSAMAAAKAFVAAFVGALGMEAMFPGLADSVLMALGLK